MDESVELRRDDPSGVEEPLPSLPVLAKMMRRSYGPCSGSRKWVRF